MVPGQREIENSQEIDERQSDGYQVAVVVMAYG